VAFKGYHSASLGVDELKDSLCAFFGSVVSTDEWCFILLVSPHFVSPLVIFV
jgi:hypothetical protein